MQQLTNIVETFPSAVIPRSAPRLPIEVSLIAQLGHGAGSHVFHSVANRQRGHAQFRDELDEPSVKLGGTDFERGDPSALYSFVVGPNGHPFHRHAGNRMFTAISGSGGAQLRFSTVADDDLEDDPQAFVDGMHYVNIPPDCLFSVRFGGQTWHQFGPLSKNSLHPVFFALSCHTDELGGDLPEELRARVMAGEADIPSLTEVLPEAVASIIHAPDFPDDAVPTTTLALDAPAGTFHRLVCDNVRGGMGILRGLWSRQRRASGYISKATADTDVVELGDIPQDSILLRDLMVARAHHRDSFELVLDDPRFGEMNAAACLEMLLEGFLNNAPEGVSRLMGIRNMLVKPLGLRTSPLGCPVSSLLSNDRSRLFADRFPVLDQAIDQDVDKAQVLLGVDDKHLAFRSVVAVDKISAQRVKLTLGTAVTCNNAFGHLYMAAISLVHRRYISPTMLRRSADYLIANLN